MAERDILRTHMEDLAQKAQKTGMAHSKFLSAAQAAQVDETYRTRRDVCLRLEGGFAEAERRVALFTQPEWGSCQLEEVVVALELCHRPQDEIRHKDILGAALGLGLSRDILGDIWIGPERAVLVCLAPMAEFIEQELKQVGRVGVSVQRLPLSQLPSGAAQLTEKVLTVASLRLDALVAEAFNLSRSAACKLIEAGKVQLAHQECLNTSAQVKEGQILSVRGKGRVKLLEVQALSRKGRQRVLLGYFG